MFLASAVVAMSPPPPATAAPPTGAAASMLRAAPSTTPVLEVWVELEGPALGALADASAERREETRQRIVAEQDAAMQRLGALGATEIGRVSLLRNAVAVRLPADRLAAARALPGVRSLRVVRSQQLHP